MHASPRRNDLIVASPLRRGGSFRIAARGESLCQKLCASFGDTVLAVRGADEISHPLDLRHCIAHGKRCACRFEHGKVVRCISNGCGLDRGDAERRACIGDSRCLRDAGSIHLDEDVRLQAVQKELVTINDEASFKALFESNAPESGIDFSNSSLVFVWGETSGELVDVFKEVLPRSENYLLNVSVTTSSHVSATRTWFVGYIVPKFKAANFTLQLAEHSL